MLEKARATVAKDVASVKKRNRIGEFNRKRNSRWKRVKDGQVVNEVQRSRENDTEKEVKLVKTIPATLKPKLV